MSGLISAFPPTGLGTDGVGPPYGADAAPRRDRQVCAARIRMSSVEFDRLLRPQHCREADHLADMEKVWKRGVAETDWWARRDSNPQPSGYEPPALTIELQAPRRCISCFWTAAQAGIARRRRLPGTPRSRYRLYVPCTRCEIFLDFFIRLSSVKSPQSFSPQLCLRATLQCWISLRLARRFSAAICGP